MEPFGDDITRDVFLASGWETLISECAPKECTSYCSPFLDAGNRANDGGEKQRSSILRLLGHLTGMWPKLDSPEDPYDACIQSSSGRTAMLDDFDDTHLEFLKAIIADITDAELQARVADILWFRKRDYKHGEMAVEAYLISAKTLEDYKNWSATAHRLERAIQIGASLGKNAPAYTNAVTHIEALILQCDGNDPSYLSLELMEMLIGRKDGNAIAYSALAEKLAVRAEEEHDWQRAHQYWDIKGRWLTKAGDKEGARQAQIAAAETYVKHAEWILQRDNPQYLVASCWMQSGAEAMFRIAGQRERAQELHAFLLDYQQRSMSEMRATSHSTDVTELASIAVEAVKNKGLADALDALARIGSICKMTSLREQVIEDRTKFVLQNLFHRTYLNAAGRVIAQQPKDEEERNRADMWRNASLGHVFIVQAQVEPARQQILIEHNVRLHDFAPYVMDSPFVRPDRENIVARGLYAGMQGDLLLSTHLLIPQIEDSVRFILSHKEVITSGLDHNGIQEEFDLNRMLTSDVYTKPLAEVLGEDFVFDLRGLLVERFGANLRNDASHGLIGYNAFYSHEAYYFWWLALRFYAWPTRLGLRTQASSERHVSNDDGLPPDAAA